MRNENLFGLGQGSEITRLASPRAAFGGEKAPKDWRNQLTVFKTRQRASLRYQIITFVVVFAQS
jgi:hypothetical protein